jgi:hypothetical protein
MGDLLLFREAAGCAGDAFIVHLSNHIARVPAHIFAAGGARISSSMLAAPAALPTGHGISVILTQPSFLRILG